MDRSLDDMITDRRQNERSNSNSGRRNQRHGIRKPPNRRNDYSEDRLWTHDKFSLFPQEASKESFTPSYRSSKSSNAGPSSDTKLPPGSAKIKVDNLHYELGEDDLMELFKRQGPVYKLDLIYDRAGRSEGVAYVIYQNEADANRAIKEYNGANANGQPISLSFVSRAASTQQQPRSLFERIKNSPDVNIVEPRQSRRGDRGDAPDPRRDPTRKPTPPGIDRYVPPERRRASSVRGGGERRGGERRGERRGTERPARGGGDNKRTAPRPKKTVEELDEEMNDYFSTSAANGAVESNGSGAEAGATPPAAGSNPFTAGAAPSAPPAPASATQDEDEDMIL